MRKPSEYPKSRSRIPQTKLPIEARRIPPEIFTPVKPTFVSVPTAPAISPIQEFPKLLVVICGRELVNIRGTVDTLLDCLADVDLSKLALTLVLDQSNPTEVSKISDIQKSLVKNQALAVTCISGPSQGGSINWNRGVKYFLGETALSEILFISSGSVFLNPGWRRSIRESYRETGIGLFGTALGSEKVVSGGSYSTSTEVASLPCLWGTREVFSQVGYFDPKIELDKAIPLFIQRAYRHFKWGKEYFFLDASTIGEIVSLDRLQETPVERSIRKSYAEKKDQTNWQSGLIECDVSCSRIPAHGKSSYRRFRNQHSLFPDQEFTFMSAVVPKERTTEAKVTVIIGHRGEGPRRRNLEKVLRHIWSQTEDVYVVLVEQDETPKVADIADQVDDYVFCHSNRPYNRGWAFNVGSRRAKTEYLLLHDNDICVPSQYLTWGLRRINGFDAVKPWSKIHYLDEETSTEWPSDKYNCTLVYTSLNVHGGSLLIRRDFFDHVGGFDERFEGWGAEDDAFFWKITRLGKVASFKGIDPGLYHLWHPRGNPEEDWAVKMNYNLLTKYMRLSNSELSKLADLSRKTYGNPNRYVESLGGSPLKTSDKIRLHIVYDVPGWAYHKRALALQKYAPEDFFVTIGSDVGNYPSDVVFLLPYGNSPGARDAIRAKNPEAKLITSYNVGYGRRMEYLKQSIHSSDLVVINNLDCWERSGKLNNTVPLANGVDLSTFYCTRPPQGRKHKVLWTGSIYHAELKGYKSILKPLAERLKEIGVETDLKLVDSHSPHILTSAQMREWYNSGTIYVCASESEGTPNPALESAACGCVVISTPVGNMPELIVPGENGYLVDRTVEAFFSAIQASIEDFDRLTSNMQKRIQSWDWRARSLDFFDLFRRIHYRGVIPNP